MTSFEGKTFTVAALLAVGDAAKFTAGTLMDAAYERVCDGIDQIAQLAVANGWAVFAEHCTLMALNLQEEEEDEGGTEDDINELWRQCHETDDGPATSPKEPQ